MTDEEMAEEYANNQVGCGDGYYEWDDVKDAFLAGLKAGRPQWHKVADGDYPKEKGNYLVAWKRTHHVEEYGLWGFDVDLFNADEGYFEGVGDYVIAWCEIPTFDKE